MSSDIIMFGMGAMGRRMARLVSERGHRIRAAIDLDPAKRDLPLRELPDLDTGPADVRVSAEPDAALDRPGAVVLHATGSFLHEVEPQIRRCIEHGHDVVSIAEEMAFPSAADAATAAALDDTARAHGVRVLGTGVNPGFAMDVLLLALTAPCGRVDHVQATRRNDLSDFGATVLRTQGVGLTPEEFAAALAAGTVVGHIGFRQSIMLVARGLGWRIDEIVETREPIVSEVERSTPHVRVLPGQVAGCHHCAVARSGGREVLRFAHPQQIRPELEGRTTSDEIRVTGDQEIHMTITPEIGGGAGTAACAVNAVDRLAHAPAGLVHVTDLPIAAPRIGGADRP